MSMELRAISVLLGAATEQEIFVVFLSVQIHRLLFPLKASGFGELFQESLQEKGNKPFLSKANKAFFPAIGVEIRKFTVTSKQPCVCVRVCCFVPPSSLGESIWRISGSFRVGAHPVSSTHTYNSNFTADLL